MYLLLWQLQFLNKVKTLKLLHFHTSQQGDRWSGSEERDSKRLKIYTFKKKTRKKIY